LERTRNSATRFTPRRTEDGRPKTEDRVIDVEIESVNAAGDGVARDGRRRLIVPFTIPGERVRVSIARTHGDVTVGAVESILDESSHRVIPACPHFGPPQSCGGCTWQHIAYPEQLRLKTKLVSQLVQKAVPGAPAARPMLPGAPIDNPWGYRHKVHFVFGAGHQSSPETSDRRAPRYGAPGSRGSLTMGHYARGSRRVIPVRECPVHAPRGNAVAFRFRDSYRRAGLNAAPDGPLKSLALRVGFATPELMATLVLTGESVKALRSATRRILSEPDPPSSVHVNLHPKGDAFIFGDETRRVAGPARMREDVAGVSFLISPTAFFQTNVQAADTLVRLVLEAMRPGARVLDLYAGAGLFALPLARAGYEVVAVEENRAAVSDARESMKLNRIPESRCRFLMRRVEDALTSAAVRGPFDLVVLDPPREGCSASVIDGIFGGLAPAGAIYISCNPEALARDLALITGRRYAIESIQPVDMFPHTAHVESVVVLRRRT
jgi:23S rRNA (uracil1939-C5)-methyltransferase